MIVKEVLLEYNRQVTANQVGNRLLLSLARDTSPLPNGLLGIRSQLKTLGNIQDPSKINAVIPAAVITKWTEYLLEVIESQDPTPNKIYTPWLAKMYAKSGGGLRLEDMNRNDLLRLYDVAKKRRMIKPEHADINRFKWYQDFEDTMENEYNNLTDVEQGAEQKEGNAQKIYDDSDVTIVVPKDEEAACKYGRGTRWCTAATRGYNYFNQYNRTGPLYILIPKKPKYQGEKYQLHFPSNQYMDENDDPIPLTEIFVRFPGIKEFLLKTEPDLREKIMFAPDEVLTQAIASVTEIVREKAWETINDWESSDDGYWQALRDNGLVDPETGEVDWDEVERFGLSYTDYNPELIRWENDIINDASPTPNELREIIADDPYEYENFDSIKHIPDVIGTYLTSKYYGRRDEGDANIGKYLREKISMRKEGDKWVAYHVPSLRLPPRTDESIRKTLGTIGAAGALAAAGIAGYNGMHQQPSTVTTTAPAVKKQESPDFRVLAQTIWGEARSHGAKGMLAIANVIKNRAEDTAHARLFGSGIRGVALKPKQFSCWNKGDPNRDRLKEILQYEKLIHAKKAPGGIPFKQWFNKFKHSGEYLEYKAWLTAKKIAHNVLNGTAPDPTHGAVYYHTTSVQPIWRHKLQQVATVGNHVFYTFPDTDTLKEYNVDNKEGLGATGYNANVEYRGLRVLMRPSIFLQLAYPLNEPSSKEYIMQHMKNGGSLGSPYLIVDIPEGYFNDNFADYPLVIGHEGRNRMMAIFEIEGDDPVEVHLFPYGEVRARDLTEEIVNHLRIGMINQARSKIITNGINGLFQVIE